MAKGYGDLYDNGKRESGVYNVTRPNKQVLKVYCDMETDGGGWTVIQRRNDGSTDFNRGWSDYKHGFGDVEKNMWIGLENMHSLAGLNSNTTLRIELKHRLKGDELFFAKYGSFKIGNETDGYRIRVSGYSGTADCKDLYDTGKRDSGIYHITRPNKQVLEVYCDMETDGGGWTVIQRRIDGSTDFNRGWSDYKDGFGDVGKNMWMGLENMHSLASPNASTTLRIDLKHRLKGDELFFATYRSFQISDESDRYRIRVSGYSGTAGDAFNIENARKNNKMQFFTKDRDNNHNCAQQYKSGWWYNGCHNCQLNGLFPSTDTPHPTYMSWIPIDGDTEDP
eukprot:gene13615-biopygen3606